MKIVILGLFVTSSWGNGHATANRWLVRELTRRVLAPHTTGHPAAELDAYMEEQRHPSFDLIRPLSGPATACKVQLLST